MDQPNRTPPPTDGGGTSSQVMEKASDVGSEVGAQAKAVAREATDHFRGLADRARGDVREQAQARTGQAAQQLRSLSSQLSALADGDAQAAGPLVDYLRDAGDRVTRLAGRLDRGPDAVLDDVRRFARRRPMVFLGAAGVLGFAAGRLLRSGASASSESSDVGSPAYATDIPVVPAEFATPTVPPPMASTTPTGVVGR